MQTDQIVVLSILAAALAMFLWGRWRHDMVAVAALLACVFTGLVPAAEAFAGFGHPAVVTVACVLVLSRGLQTSGAVDVLARTVLPSNAGPTLTIAALTALGALLSAFMNNVGALALLMPVAVQMSARLQLPPGKVLMPLAFGSILGGTTTLIGTPPNLIVSGFRSGTELGGFGIFDFTPVGAAVAGVGVLFLALVGWRLVPTRERGGAEGFEAGAYLTETRVVEGTKAVGMKLREIQRILDDSDAQVLGLVRNEVRVVAPHPGRVVMAGDILVIEAEAEALAGALSSLDLQLEEAKKPSEVDEAVGDDDTVEDEANEVEAAEVSEKAPKEEPAKADEEIVLMELAILPASSLVGRSASDVLLRTRFGINLLAVSRQGRRSMARLRALALKAGDLLLVQGPPEAILDFAGASSCVPLAKRELRIPDRRKAILATGILLAAIVAAALRIVSPPVAFAAGVLASMALRTVPPRSAYDAVDWPVVVLLGALIPVAGAMQTTGTADLLAASVFERAAGGDPVIAVAIIMISTMFLTDLMNNAATAAVMSPIGLGAALQLGVNPDTFLMAVAIGSSCSFLTPIGHQNNTLILGPGGFRFTDYWRLGFLLSLFVIATGLPVLLWAWPL